MCCQKVSLESFKKYYGMIDVFYCNKLFLADSYYTVNEIFKSEMSVIKKCKVHESHYVTITVTQFISKKITPRKRLGLSETTIFLTNVGCSELLIPSLPSH